MLILNGTILIGGKGDEMWAIDQDDTNKKFYITSSKGYNGYEGKGDYSLLTAVRHVHKLIAQS